MSLSIKQLSEEKFWWNFSKKTAKKSIPFSVTFELTYNCNLRCCHCYIVADPEKRELSSHEVYSILDQLAAEGCFQVGFTGGEIFARSDILDILRYTREKGFYITLLTNAILITPEIARRLQKIGINEIDISLYGITKKTYEAITGIEGSFERCLQSIDLLQRMNISIHLNMVVMNLNVAEIKQVIEFAERHKLGFRFSCFVYPRADGSKEPLHYRLSPKKAIEVELRMRDYSNLINKQRNEEEICFKKRPPEKQEFFYCQAGRNSMIINPYGEMSLCLRYRLFRYDLRRRNVADGWKELVNYVKSARPSENYRCRDCNLRRYCSWCPADGLLECGDINVCVPYMKELALLTRKLVERGALF